MSAEQYKLQSFSLWNSRHSPVTCSLLDFKHLQSVFFIYNDRVSHPYKVIYKFTVLHTYGLLNGRKGKETQVIRIRFSFLEWDGTKSHGT
jgi:hypothetical protein